MVRAQRLGLTAADSACLLQHVADTFEREHRLNNQACISETLFGSRVMATAMVKEHHHVVDREA